MSRLIAYISCKCGKLNERVTEPEDGMCLAGTAAWKMARHEAKYHPKAGARNPPTWVKYTHE